MAMDLKLYASFYWNTSTEEMRRSMALLQVTCDRAACVVEEATTFDQEFS